MITMMMTHNKSGSVRSSADWHWQASGGEGMVLLTDYGPTFSSPSSTASYWQSDSHPDCLYHIPWIHLQCWPHLVWAGTCQAASLPEPSPWLHNLTRGWTSLVLDIIIACHLLQIPWLKISQIWISKTNCWQKVWSHFERKCFMSWLSQIAADISSNEWQGGLWFRKFTKFLSFKSSAMCEVRCSLCLVTSAFSLPLALLRQNKYSLHTFLVR